jgi:hypothetical protein
VKLQLAEFVPPPVPDAENFARNPVLDAVFRESDSENPGRNPLKLPEGKAGKPPHLNDLKKQLIIDLTVWQKYFVEAGVLPEADADPAVGTLTAVNRWALNLYPVGWDYRSLVRGNRYIDEAVAQFDPARRRYFSDRPLPSAPSGTESLTQKIYNRYFEIVVPVGPVKGYVRAATTTDHVRLACSLERFRMARGAYPEKLAELVPEFIPEIPAEIVNGEPYRYRRTDDGSFVLYSVGLDLHDDGGMVDPAQKDWVWRYPVP